MGSSISFSISAGYGNEEIATEKPQETANPAACETDIATTEEKSSACESRINEYIASDCDLRSQLEQLNVENAALQNACRRHVNELAQKSEQLSAQGKLVETKCQEINVANAARDELQLEVAQLGEVVETKAQEASALQDELQLKITDLTEDKITLENTISALRSESEAVRKTQAATTADLEANRAERDELQLEEKRTYKHLEEENSSLVNKAADAQDLQARMTVDLKEARAETDDFHRKVTALQESQSVLKETISILARWTTDAQNAQTRAAVDLKAEKAVTKGLQRTVTELEASKGGLEKANSDLTTEVTNTHNCRDRTAAELKASQELASRTMVAKMVADNEITRMRAQIQEQEQSIYVHRGRAAVATAPVPTTGTLQPTNEWRVPTTSDGHQYAYETQYNVAAEQRMIPSVPAFNSTPAATSMPTVFATHCQNQLIPMGTQIVQHGLPTFTQSADQASLFRSPLASYPNQERASHHGLTISVQTSFPALAAQNRSIHEPTLHQAPAVISGQNSHHSHFHEVSLVKDRSHGRNRTKVVVTTTTVTR